MKIIRKIITLLLIFSLTIVCAVGCGGKTEVTDREGNTITIPDSTEKIISTAPSNTEILVGLGLGDKLIAVDEYSMDVEGIPSDVATIDFTNVDVEAIVAMEPDLVVASSMNKSGGDDPFVQLEEAGITVVYIPTSESFEEIYEDINFIAEVTGTEDKGEVIVKEMKEQIKAIKDIADTITNKKTVYFEVTSSPSLYTTGNNTFINDMINMVGATNVFEDEDGWVAISEEAVISANPDVIITNEDYLDDATEIIKHRTGFETINAVINDEVYLVGNNATARPSQNAISGLKEIAKAIYPEYYD